MNTKTLKEEAREEFYQHMLKSTPVLDAFERASLKLKFLAIIDKVIEAKEREFKEIVKRVAKKPAQYYTGKDTERVKLIQEIEMDILQTLKENKS